MFTARVSSDEQYSGASAANFPYYHTGDFSLAANPVASGVETDISIVSPEEGQVFMAPDGISVMVPITIVTPLALPEEGYWRLDIGGQTVASQVLTSATTASLGLGSHAISATLYTVDHRALGARAVGVTILSFAQRMDLPMVTSDADTGWHRSLTPWPNSSARPNACQTIANRRRRCCCMRISPTRGRVSAS